MSVESPVEQSPVASLRLKTGADRRLRAGHLWIYSNEVNTDMTPLKGLSAGAAVVVEDARGHFVGMASVNPSSLICARLYSLQQDRQLDRSLITQRLKQAMKLREQCFEKPFYRAIFGDSDLLPGLVVDRFGDYLSVQLTTAAMDSRRDEVIAALDDVFSAKGILLRNQGSFRTMEGLSEYVEVVAGEIPERVELEENGVRFLAPLLTGQKTGWYYDHRENRQRLQHLAKDKSVLDVYSYVGGWGVQAAAAGASSVTCIDVSGDALALAQENAALNNYRGEFTTLQGKANDLMKSVLDQGRTYDLVVLDPPAFIKRRKDQRQGEKAYHQINQLALRLLAPGGTLVSASCSMHLSREALMDVVKTAAAHRHRQLQVFAQGEQGPDHPVHPAIPETSYLKAIFARDIAD
ncbi:class I SAM-dependent rRNA methyltransferase [Porticoccus sp.]|uniref:class I SAM-dependent rRNA methyltransferase n=1 Tax=Porticoccus sp. TaxID=2024853 RepID=UPI003F6958CF